MLVSIGCLFFGGGGPPWLGGSPWGEVGRGAPLHQEGLPYPPHTRGALLAGGAPLVGGVGRGAPPGGGAPTSPTPPQREPLLVEGAPLSDVIAAWWQCCWSWAGREELSSVLCRRRKFSLLRSSSRTFFAMTLSVA